MNFETENHSMAGYSRAAENFVPLHARLKILAFLLSTLSAHFLSFCFHREKERLKQRYYTVKRKGVYIPVHVFLFLVSPFSLFSKLSKMKRIRNEH